jgi:hypothetical protein
MHWNDTARSPRHHPGFSAAAEDALKPKGSASANRRQPWILINDQFYEVMAKIASLITSE